MICYGSGITWPEWSPESRNPIPWTLPPLHCGGYGIESGLTKSLFIAASAAPPLLPPRGEELEQRGVEWCCDEERFCQSRLYSVPSTVQWGKSSWNRISWFGTSLGFPLLFHDSTRLDSFVSWWCTFIYFWRHLCPIFSSFSGFTQKNPTGRKPENKHHRPDGPELKSSFLTPSSISFFLSSDSSLLTFFRQNISLSLWPQLDCRGGNRAEEEEEKSERRCSFQED